MHSQKVFTATPISPFFQRSSFVMVIAFVSSHLYHTSKTLLVKMTLAERTDIIFNTEGFLDEATEIRSEWYFNTQSLNLIQVP